MPTGVASRQIVEIGPALYAEAMSVNHEADANYVRAVMAEGGFPKTRRLRTAQGVVTVWIGPNGRKWAPKQRGSAK